MTYGTEIDYSLAFYILCNIFFLSCKAYYMTNPCTLLTFKLFSGKVNLLKEFKEAYDV